VDLSKEPDTYVPPEPFTGYRSWIWTSEGVTSLFNGVPWTPKVPFEARCLYGTDLRSMQAAALTPEAKAFWERQRHRVPDPSCTCGTYAGIDMQHLISLRYTQFGVHGEVSLWGRLYRHTLGWRAQYAYPKYFVIPAFVIPVKVEEAQRRIAKLTEYDVDVYVQPEREARVGQERIPLWVRDYGYSQQGISFLIERWTNWDSRKITHTLKVGDRVAVFRFSDVNGGIGVVKEITGDEMFYTLFNKDVVYRKKVKDVVWNERNWRWETTGLGMMRKLERETTPRNVPR
jgi:hypothetical protein